MASARPVTDHERYRHELEIIPVGAGGHRRGVRCPVPRGCGGGGGTSDRQSRPSSSARWWRRPPRRRAADRGARSRRPDRRPCAIRAGHQDDGRRDGSFTLRGLPEGGFTLIFTQAGTVVGTLAFQEVAANQQITINVALADGEIVLVDEDRRGIGHAGSSSRASCRTSSPSTRRPTAVSSSPTVRWSRARA